MSRQRSSDARYLLCVVLLLLVIGVAWTIAHAFETPRAARAQGVADAHLVGQIGGAAVAVAFAGNTAYLGLGMSVTVLDAADPGQPRVVGRMAPLPCTVTDVAVQADRLYVVFGTGVNVYGLTDPTAPALLGGWLYADACSTGGAGRITLSGDYAYTTGRGLLSAARDKILDIRNPKGIGIVGLFAHGPKTDIAVGGGRLYAAEDTFLDTYDLTDPTRPVEQGRLELGIDDGYANAVAYADGHVFVGTGGGLVVADPDLPTHPRLSTGAYVHDVVARDGRAYLATGTGGGLQVIDVRDVSAPRPLGSVTVGDARHVALIGHYAYVSSEGDGLWVVDITDPAALEAEQVLTTWSGAGDVELAGTTAFVAADDSGIVSVDVSDPAAPRTLSTAPVLGVASRLSVDGDRAYVLGVRSGPPGTLNVFDITTPAALRSTGTVTLYGGAMALDGADGLAYVCDSVGGLRVFDTRPADGPRELGSTNVGVGDDVLVAGDHAYVVDVTYGLRVIDVADPGHMRQVGELPFRTQGATGIAYSGGRLYVSELTRSGEDVGELPQDLLVVDVADPTHPTRVRPVALGVDRELAFPRDIATGADRAYIASGTREWAFGSRGFSLFVVPLDDPATVPQWRLPMPDQARGVDRMGDLLAVAANAAGLLVMRPDPAPTPAATTDRPTAWPTVTLTVPATETPWHGGAQVARYLPLGWR